MLHTPLKHTHPAAVAHHGHVHAPAQHAQPSPSTRCSPHSVHGPHSSIPAHAHELNLADWLHMSPAQVAMMSPVAAPYTPPNHHHHHLFVPTPSPLQYASVVANANARNDFLATSSLSYSSPPLQVPAPYHHHHLASNHYASNPHQQAQVPTIAVSVDNMHQQLQDQLAAAAHTAMGPSPLSAEYFPYAANGSAPTLSASTSPISHQGSPFPFQGYGRRTGEGESTPVTTLSVTDESQARAYSQEKGPSQPFIERLRGASPVTDAGTNPSGSPERPATAQRRPVESTESPFRIAAPQPRPGSGLFSPLPPSSRPTSALGALSELAELASRQSTPSLQPPVANPSTLASPAPISHPPSRPISRPASALSTRSTASHAKGPKVRRRQVPPRRFEPSILRVQLPYQHTPGSGEGHANSKPMTPSLVDNLPRGPLEFEDEGHRYRTRSKLRSLKAEIQEREREADLMLIRRGLRGEGADPEAESRSGLEMLASVSVTRRIDLEDSPPKRSETPASSVSHAQKAPRPKRPAKRAFKDIEDADCESVTTASECGSRSPSKRPRIPTEKAALAKVKKEVVETRTLRSRVKRDSQGKPSTRPSPARVSANQKSKKAKPTAPKNAKVTSAAASAGKKKLAAAAKTVKEDVPMDVGDSELSSLSSMSETEDGNTSDYSPKKNLRSSRSKGASASPARAISATSTSASKAPAKTKSTSMTIDTARGAAAIPMPVRTFPAEVPIHADFPLLYRKFPVPGYTDPNFNNFLSFSSPLSSVTSSPSLTLVALCSSARKDASEKKDEKEGKAEDELPVPPPPSSGHYNAPRSADDLYTPRFVRGVGRDKMGLCPICYESPERGGAGRAEWLSMKFSAFNYHMQYAHGISPVTAQPFSPPIAFRITSRTPNHKNEKSELLEGKCHHCQEWAPVEGVKCVEAKLKEIYWWKHAAQCHRGSTISGEKDALLEDGVAARVRKVFDAVHARQHPTVPVLPAFCAAAVAAKAGQTLRN